MTPSRGYREAKQLLQKHYGDELRIASAYIDKALKWQQVKSEDGKALSAYAMFLIGCLNTMKDIEYLDEMDNPTNLRTVVSKLPYKMRERWRGRRAKFADLVKYIDRQAKISSDPLFGNIPDSRPTTTGKVDQKENFATNVSAENKSPQETYAKPATSNKAVSAFEKPCLYCQQSHTLASCSKIKAQPHKDRVDFLKSKGLCFGCLVPGHLSKFCKKRIECKECASKHPDILHIEGSAKPEKMENTHEARWHVHRFLSSKSLVASQGLEKLNTREARVVKGKPTRILLSTMGQDKPEESKLMNSFTISDLEVCRLDDTNYIDLPKVFTHRNIPVHSGNIPKQSDFQKWPYLKEVSLPEIKADIGLLIGANCSRAMEPWHVINSQDGGPYAVKTAIGWVVNGPIRKELKDREQTT
ncbi:hypothetical protein N1851_018927 [Merluccius polli]|uniref:Peptidase aspartic putative domain-containing protein n=1 Tax=Merluccius polli TaxID=89951 RepID=A0AA47NZJ7_MERPO|nr:hypothetical protein N1851_018927 [Merluccius polli]